jgi:hypothetical protein
LVTAREQQYPSDLPDDEWAVVEPLLPPPGEWFDAVDATGGAVVVALADGRSGPDLSALAARPDARGGFVRLMPA